jgi:magnesium transporter
MVNGLIAGIYGMNFAHMPELSWQWGYPGVWLLMAVVSIGLAMFFRRIRWW